MKLPERENGYAPIRDYAFIGDGRTGALVALDGSIDWLCLPTLDSPPAFWRLLDAERGGFFRLAPRTPFEARRRYRDESNVLETTFTTRDGVASVTDACLMDGGAPLPWVELVRRVQGLEGEVAIEWHVAARPRWGEADAQVSTRGRIPSIEWDDEGIVVLCHDAGKPRVRGGDISGAFRISAGESALVALLHFDGEPFAAPPREELELRLERTEEYWISYTRDIPYNGPWLADVRRGVLAQRLLTNPETGAIAAAATTSLPERIGGDKNWDYRYGWIRDTALALESLLAVRLTVDCHRTLAWVLEASARTNPDVRPFYGLHGETELPRFDVEAGGYRGSRPVRVGNDAHRQLQLGGFGDIMDAAYRYCSRGHILDAPDGRRLAVLADRVCELWHHDDSGIWEIEPRPYTNSKMACWAMLDHAVELAESGQLPDENVKAWRDERAAIRTWVDQHSWSERRQAFVGWAGGDELDASVLLAARWGIVEAADERYLSTVRALREELGSGPFLYRLTGARADEGCFLACSFWLVDGLARAGRVDEARELMEELLPAANDVGLYAEMIDPDTRELLGNFPQALTHLSLVLAAVSVMRAERAQL